MKLAKPESPAQLPVPPRRIFLPRFERSTAAAEDKPILPKETAVWHQAGESQLPESTDGAPSDNFVADHASRTSHPTDVNAAATESTDETSAGETGIATPVASFPAGDHRDVWPSLPPGMPPPPAGIAQESVPETAALAETDSSPPQEGAAHREVLPAEPASPGYRTTDTRGIADAGATEQASAEDHAPILLPRESAGTSKGITLLFMRVLGRRSDERPPRQLAKRAAAKISPSINQGPPPPQRRGFFRRFGLFFLCAIFPTLVAAIYFGSYATDVYVSESRFVVRAPNKQGSASDLSGMLSGVGLTGFGRAPEDVQTVSQYALSRDALQVLDNRLDLRGSWGDEKIDIFRRFDPLGLNSSREDLFEYYPRRVASVVDPASGITTLTVSSFTPDQSLEINKILLGEAERLVNDLNDRARTDLVRFAENEVRVAEEKAKAAALAVSSYRNTEAVVDPEKQTELHFQQISRLQEELMRTQSQLTQLRVFAPDSPHPPALQLRAQTLQSEITKEMEKITGGENSLASKAAEYERLALEREFADKQLAGALASLEQARNEAQRQQLYLETIAKPSSPDGPLYPRRIRGVLTAFVLGLIVWGIFSILFAGVREHHS